MLSLDDAQLTLILRLVLGAGVVAVLMMGLDKLLAVSRSYRISERFLWLLAFAGGFWGAVPGGILFRHKIYKPSFWVPVGLALIAWGAFYYLISH